VLDDADGPSSPTASMLRVVELLEGRTEATAANGVCWGSCSVLVTIVSHFLELNAELEVLGSWCNVDLTEDDGICPPDLGSCGLGLADVVCSFLGCP
jgi:hypothetical protein